MRNAAHNSHLIASRDAKDDSPDMSAPHAALVKRLEEVATKDWLMVLHGE